MSEYDVRNTYSKTKRRGWCRYMRGMWYVFLVICTTVQYTTMGGKHKPCVHQLVGLLSNVQGYKTSVSTPPSTFASYPANYNSSGFSIYSPVIAFTY